MPSLSPLMMLLWALPSAQADYPDDLSPSGLGEHAGTPLLDTGLAAAAYQQTVLEMAAAIANKPTNPGDTLGLHGMDLSLTQSMAFISSQGSTTEPSAWERMDGDEDPNRVLWIPKLGIRKGLLGSLELGGDIGYIGSSRQTTFGAYGRWGLIEGYTNLPTLSIHGGYTGYLGNPELKLGVMDLGATLGYTLAFGTLPVINTATFSPYVGGALLRAHARPDIDPLLAEDLGIAAQSGFSGADNFTEDYQLTQLHGGFRVVSGAFSFRVAATWVPSTLVTLTVGTGLIF